MRDRERVRVCKRKSEKKRERERQTERERERERELLQSNHLTPATERGSYFSSYTSIRSVSGDTTPCQVWGDNPV